MTTVEIPKSLFVSVDKTFYVEAIEHTEDEVVKIKIGEEIPTTIKVLDSKGNVVEIPMCFNCLKHPAIIEYLCSTCLEFEKIEDCQSKKQSPNPYCENDLINTNFYTQ